jgi:hypothetical protein
MKQNLNSKMFDSKFYYKYEQCFRVTSLFKTEASYSIHIIK